MTGDSPIRETVFRIERRMHAARNRPTLFGRFAAHVFILVALVLSLIVLIPLLVLFLTVAILVWVYGRLRAAVMRATSPNGVLDGRRNVRVIDPNSRRAAAGTDSFTSDTGTG